MSFIKYLQKKLNESRRNLGYRYGDPLYDDRELLLIKINKDMIAIDLVSSDIKNNVIDTFIFKNAKDKIRFTSYDCPDYQFLEDKIIKQIPDAANWVIETINKYKNVFGELKSPWFVEVNINGNSTGFKFAVVTKPDFSDILNKLQIIEKLDKTIKDALKEFMYNEDNQEVNMEAYETYESPEYEDFN